MLKLKLRIKGLFSLEKTKKSQRKKNLFFIVLIFREKMHTHYGKIKGVDRFLQHMLERR
jgi:hypothetical protein